MNTNLPPLPKTRYVLAVEGDGYSPDRLTFDEGYSDDDMHAYARKAIETVVGQQEQTMTLLPKKPVAGMTVDLPKPVTTLRHRRRFERDEVIEALKHYLVSNGAKVPEGECYLTGIESYSQQEEYLTLMIDEKISP